MERFGQQQREQNRCADADCTRHDACTAAPRIDEGKSHEQGQQHCGLRLYQQRIRKGQPATNDPRILCAPSTGARLIFAAQQRVNREQRKATRNRIDLPPQRRDVDRRRVEHVQRCGGKPKTGSGKPADHRIEQRADAKIGEDRRQLDEVAQQPKAAIVSCEEKVPKVSDGGENIKISGRIIGKADR